MHHSHDWTEDQDRPLKAMWLAGRTATEIASVLTKTGIRSVTREAVLGRIHRLNLQRKNRVLPWTPSRNVSTS